MGSIHGATSRTIACLVNFYTRFICRIPYRRWLRKELQSTRVLCVSGDAVFFLFYIYIYSTLLSQGRCFGHWNDDLADRRRPACQEIHWMNQMWGAVPVRARGIKPTLYPQGHWTCPSPSHHRGCFGDSFDQLTEGDPPSSMAI